MLLNTKKWISSLWGADDDNGPILPRSKLVLNDTSLERDTPGQIVSYRKYFNRNLIALE